MSTAAAQPLRRARVTVIASPLLPAETSKAQASTAIARGFGAACVAAVVVGLDGDQWLADLTFDAKKVTDVVVRDRPDDDRLWAAYIEAASMVGRCRVVATTTAPPPTPV
ncbi:MAG TPA: hypothetical protein VGF99_18680 [Myxococcota bacterium]